MRSVSSSASSLLAFQLILRTAPMRGHVIAVPSAFLVRSGSRPCTLHAARTWEVEEKFSVTGQEQQARIEERLAQMGFTYCGEQVFTDWYLDDSARQFPLIRQDCWLRFRKDLGTEGVWQLKLGKVTDSGCGDNRAATVYEEVEGRRDALDQAIAKLDHRPSKATEVELTAQEAIEFDHSNDALLVQHNLLPFAKLTTTRTSWIRQDDQLKVDLDSTNFGYTVGEVELCVHDDASVDEARQEVQKLIRTIQRVTNGTSTTLSKLEYYLVGNRPDVHKLCQDYGIL